MTANSLRTIRAILLVTIFIIAVIMMVPTVAFAIGEEAVTEDPTTTTTNAAPSADGEPVTNDTGTIEATVDTSSTDTLDSTGSFEPAVPEASFEAPAPDPVDNGTPVPGGDTTPVDNTPDENVPNDNLLSDNEVIETQDLTPPSVQGGEDLFEGNTPGDFTAGNLSWNSLRMKVLRMIFQPLVMMNLSWNSLRMKVLRMIFQPLVMMNLSWNSLRMKVLKMIFQLLVMMNLSRMCLASKNYIDRQLKNTEVGRLPSFGYVRG